TRLRSSLTRTSSARRPASACASRRRSVRSRSTTASTSCAARSSASPSAPCTSRSASSERPAASVPRACCRAAAGVIQPRWRRGAIRARSSRTRMCSPRPTTRLQCSPDSLHNVQVHLLAFLAKHYHVAPHASLLGKSLGEVYETAPRYDEKNDDAALGAALTVHGRRRARRDGTLEIGGTTFETRT